MHSEYCNTLVLRPRLILKYKIFSIGIGIVIEFSKLRYWYWYLYWFSKSGVLVLKSVSISEIWNIDIDIGIETWFFRIKYWYWLIRAGIAHLWFVSSKPGIPECQSWIAFFLYSFVTLGLARLSTSLQNTHLASPSNYNKSILSMYNSSNNGKSLIKVSPTLSRCAL